MEKAKKIKLEWDGDMIETLINKLDEDMEVYTITLTNYTCLIESEEASYHFVKHLQRPITFSISNKLKRYMDTVLDRDIDYIDRDTMKYYSVNKTPRNMYKHTAYNIDI